MFARKHSRRRLLAGSMSFIATAGVVDVTRSGAETPSHRYDFRDRALQGWLTVAGNWAVQDLPNDPGNSPALMQRSTDNEFCVIVAPAAPVADADISVRFKPISGREDASGGIVFRFSDGRYYVVRANALEDNFRLYTYEKGRRQIASARVSPPALGRWHTIRVSALGDRIQAWLNDQPLLDHRDRKFTLGKVGLWTKADSVTAFKDLTFTPK